MTKVTLNAISILNLENYHPCQKFLMDFYLAECWFRLGRKTHFVNGFRLELEEMNRRVENQPTLFQKQAQVLIFAWLEIWNIFHKKNKHCVDFKISIDQLVKITLILWSDERKEEHGEEVHWSAEETGKSGLVSLDEIIW